MGNEDCHYSNEPLTVPELEQICKIDREVYNKKYIDSFEHTLELYKRNFDCYTTVRINNTIIGYICCIPIDNETRDRFLSGKLLNDVAIKTEHIKMSRTYYETLYIYSIAIEPGHQGSGAIHKLIEGFENKLEGMRYNKLMALGVSPKGKAVLTKLHLTERIKLSNEVSLFVS